MDIHIELNKIKLAPSSREQLISFLKKKYEHYPFIKKMELKIALNQDDEMKVSLQTKPEKGKMLFASESGKDLKTTVNHCRNKLDFQIERYKETHYNSVHKSKKSQ